MSAAFQMRPSEVNADVIAQCRAEALATLAADAKPSFRDGQQVVFRLDADFSRYADTDPRMLRLQAQRTVGTILRFTLTGCKVAFGSWHGYVSFAQIEAAPIAAPATTAPLCAGDTVAPKGFGGVTATVVEIIASGVANGEARYRCEWIEPALGVMREARFLLEDLTVQNRVEG